MSNKPMSSYTIYNTKFHSKLIENPLAEIFPQLPRKKYAVIYADPPWHYNGKMQFDRSGTLKENPDWTRDIFISSAAFKYPTLPTKELKKLRVNDITEEDALLFMWSTNPHLEQAISLGSAWGFKYKTVAFVWNKLNHNPGQYTLSYCELCLLFKKGRIPQPRGARNIKQLIEAPRSEHSQKPYEVAERITKMFPTQSKIELFARSSREGWDSWGLEEFLSSQSNNGDIFSMK
ncbi:MAG: MT-A70 family methyltransferase [Gammaproteobacteria bacterium]|nr:MT-A70 family methyltransferase [Gammaproteobacteria bacterium]MDE0403364.1 MT-A70 family methyltransferase [Gammaproteobacteria bacterium]